MRWKNPLERGLIRRPGLVCIDWERLHNVLRVGGDKKWLWSQKEKQTLAILCHAVITRPQRPMCRYVCVRWRDGLFSFLSIAEAAVRF